MLLEKQTLPTFTLNIEPGDTPLSSILVNIIYRSYTLPKMTQNGSGDICIFLMLNHAYYQYIWHEVFRRFFVNMRLKTSNATETENKRWAPPIDLPT